MPKFRIKCNKRGQLGKSRAFRQCDRGVIVDEIPPTKQISGSIRNLYGAC